MGGVMSSDSDSSSYVDQQHQVPEVPEAAPSHSSSYLGPLIRVSDPYNILSPSNSSPKVHSSSRLQSISTAASPQHSPSPSPLLRIVVPEELVVCTEIYFIRHAESSMNAKPELISGRSPSATLTALGKRQARALGVHLKSTGVDFDAVYSSPLERAKQTAYAVCQELDITRESIELTEAVQEMSQGEWEGRNRSEIYTPELVPVINSSQPDFRAPGGESQRQVEFRMIEFLNKVLLPRASSTKIQLSSTTQVHPLEDMDTDVLQAKDGEDPNDVASESHRHSPDSLSLEESVPRDVPGDVPGDEPYRLAVMSHGLAIKCMLRGVTGCHPHFTTRWCIDNASVTVVRHSTSKGWELQTVNDTSHLRLL